MKLKSAQRWVEVASTYCRCQLFNSYLVQIPPNFDSSCFIKLVNNIKISNICYFAFCYTIFISTVQQCSAHGGCTSRASASVVVVELVVVK